MNVASSPAASTHTSAPKPLFIEAFRPPESFALPIAERAGVQLVEGMRLLQRSQNPLLAGFGSARLHEGHPDYEMARELAHRAVRSGWDVLTGAGPGLMEAFNRGAVEASVPGEHSFGVKVKLPLEQDVNPWVRAAYIYCSEFFTRKLLMIKFLQGLASLKPGFGTLDELFETAYLVRTGRMRPIPIVAFGRETYDPLIEAIEAHMREQGASGGCDDLRMIEVVDSLDEGLRHLSRGTTMPFAQRQVDETMALNIWSDIEEGIQTLAGVPAHVTVHGSRHFRTGDPLLAQASQLGTLLARRELAVATYRSSPLTEAVNFSASEAGGTSIGIGTWRDDRMNGACSHLIATNHGCTARMLATRGSLAHVFFPCDLGGFDMLTEVVTLLQTRRTPDVRIYLVGERAWSPVIEAWRRTLVPAGTISAADVALMTVVPDVQAIDEDLDRRRPGT